MVVEEEEREKRRGALGGAIRGRPAQDSLHFAESTKRGGCSLEILLLHPQIGWCDLQGFAGARSWRHSATAQRRSTLNTPPFSTVAQRAHRRVWRVCYSLPKRRHPDKLGGRGKDSVQLTHLQHTPPFRRGKPSELLLGLMLHNSVLLRDSVDVQTR
jgi:hypothetical protein